MATIEKKQGIFYLYIDDYLERHGLDVYDLEEILGVSYSQALNIKNGKSKTLRIDHIIKLCERFKIQPGQLMKYKNFKTAKSYKSINEVFPVTKPKDIRMKTTLLTVTVHVVFIKEENVVSYGCPELDIFNSLNHTEDLNDVELFVLKDFYQMFEKKQSEYENINSFLYEMQIYNYWAFSPNQGKIIPAELKYYAENHDFLNAWFTMDESKIVQTELTIDLNQDQIELNAL